MNKVLISSLTLIPSGAEAVSRTLTLEKLNLNLSGCFRMLAIIAGTISTTLACKSQWYKRWCGKNVCVDMDAPSYLGCDKTIVDDFQLILLRLTFYKIARARYSGVHSLLFQWAQNKLVIFKDYLYANAAAYNPYVFSQLLATFLCSKHILLLVVS